MIMIGDVVKVRGIHEDHLSKDSAIVIGFDKAEGKFILDKQLVGYSRWAEGDLCKIIIHPNNCECEHCYQQGVLLDEYLSSRA